MSAIEETGEEQGTESGQAKKPSRRGTSQNHHFNIISTFHFIILYCAMK
jgi:hypothetical protein